VWDMSGLVSYSYSTPTGIILSTNGDLPIQISGGGTYVLKWIRVGRLEGWHQGSPAGCHGRWKFDLMKKQGGPLTVKEPAYCGQIGIVNYSKRGASLARLQKPGVQF